MAGYIAQFAVLMITLIFGLAYYSEIIHLAQQDKLIVEILLLFLAVVLMIRTVATIVNFSRFLAQRRESGEKGESFRSTARRVLRSKEVIFLTATALYIVLFPKIGFFVSSFIYVLVANYLLGIRGKLKLIAIPAGLVLFAYLLFGSVFNIKLPSGILF